jgi:NADPH:quinone reductase-like Zn-dependent oxidoreductase
MTLLSFKTRRAARRLGVRYSFPFTRASGAPLDEITKPLETGALRPIVEQTYPFANAPQALAHVEAGQRKGKLVVTMR